jgi:hypothetical protein
MTSREKQVREVLLLAQRCDELRVAYDKAAAWLAWPHEALAQNDSKSFPDLAYTIETLGEFVDRSDEYIKPVLKAAEYLRVALLFIEHRMGIGQAEPRSDDDAKQIKLWFGD